MKKSMIYRVLIYIAGLLILAMGLTLNTKAGLGVSPIISVSYSVSEITHHNFGNTTLVLYTIFVILELVLHNVREKQYEKRVEKSLRETENGTEDLLKHANRMNRKLIFVMDILQIPLSIVFTRFLNVFSSVLPAFPEGNMTAAVMVQRLLVLLLALLCTGIGAAMSLNMRIVPNPGDGIVQAIADCIHRSVGFTKNCFDVLNVTITIVISLVCTWRLHGIGIGTVLAVILVGRAIAVFNHFTKEKLTALAGIEE